MTDIVQKVGSRIRRLRSERHLSQAMLAERAGLATHTVSRIERGDQAPTLVALEQVSNALQVPLSVLVDVRGPVAESDPVEALMERVPADPEAVRACLRSALECLVRG